MLVAIDIGGTKTEIGFYKTKELNSLVDTIVFPTSQDYDVGLQSIIDSINKYSGDISSIGISLAGIVGDQGNILQVSNIPNYKDKPLKFDLEKAFNTLVTIVQDSKCSARAEWFYGDIQKYSRIVHLIMGTGLGGSFIQNINDQPQISPIEPCGLIIDINGRSHSFNKTKGLLEAYVGGGNVGDHYNIDLSKTSSSDKIWNEITDYLVIGLNNINCLLKPDIIIIGGTMGQKRQEELTPVIEKFNSYNEFVEPCKVEFTKVQGNSSLVGALRDIKNG